jgi:glutamine synthetase
LDALSELIHEIPGEALPAAQFAANELLPKMEKLRALTDQIEQKVSKSDWPIPDYNDILFTSLL